jgi:hypothetical protein
LLVSAPFVDTSAGNDAGRSYVVWGRTATTAIDLSNVVTGTGGFAINGETQFDDSGFSVASAGDIDGDGLVDLIISAAYSSANGLPTAGKTYVVWGKTSGSAIDLSNVANGTGGFVINGQNQVDNSGYSVSSAGDVNGDGLPDLLIGAPNADTGAGTDAGKSYVVWGKTSGSAIDLANVANGTGGFVIYGQSWGENSGYSISSAGDVNGDGLADLIIGAYKSSPAGISSAGRSYVVFGKTDTKAIDLSDIVSGIGSPVSFSYNGTDGANNYTGTSASEIILGGAGNDTLSGAGGTDVLLGGQGNDLLIINASNITRLQASPLVTADPAGFNYYQLARVDGGGGIDTLAVTGGASLNLTLIKQIALTNPEIGSRISSIEKLDLATDTAANTLTISLKDVVDMSGMNIFNTGSGWTSSALGALVAKHQVVINRGANDIVDLSDGSGTAGWTSVGTVLNGTITYDIWNSTTGNAQLIIQQGSTVI